MSSKKSGGKSNGEKAGGTSADGRPLGRTPKREDTPAKPAAAKKKSSLPAFGFAADLLKGRKTSSEEPAAAKDDRDKPKAKKGAKPAPRAAKTATPSRTKEAAVGRSAAAQVSATDPERVFAFADALAAGHVEEQAKKIRRETWVTLTLANETFALPVSPVREILRISSITRVPHAPYPIRGVTNLRGRVIPVLDLRIRLELPVGELSRTSRIIVVSSRGRLLGLLVDAVHQVVHLDVDLIQPPPEDVMTVQSDYISGVYHVENGLILLLNVDRALVIRDAPEPGAALFDGPPAARPSEGAVP